ncbi:MAG TPA: hypothetical protein PLD51_06330, partial [Pontiellaceae bacterium]|nr:hypothetical protein [Pontiellaceae bacterium]HPR83461.1 hypothetical protein [Pontiellaceae bacterium]
PDLLNAIQALYQLSYTPTKGRKKRGLYVMFFGVSTFIRPDSFVDVKKFLKFIIGLFFLPLCWAFSKVVFSLLQSLPAAASGWTIWALPLGFMISIVGFFILPRPFRTYVLAHELTHAVWGLLMGAKVGKMKVGKSGGHVMLSKSNFIISLAPYFFPFYTVLVIGLWYGLGCFFDVSRYEVWWLAAVGLTWGFHVTFTVYMLSQHQPDIQENGRLFSYVIIYLASLFFVALWVIVIGSPTFRGAWQLLLPETAADYESVRVVFLAGWSHLKDIQKSP